MTSCAMTLPASSDRDCVLGPQWFRFLIMALAVISLCSCRGALSPRDAENDLQAPPVAARAKAASLAAASQPDSPLAQIHSHRIESARQIEPVAHFEPCPDVENVPLGGTLPPSAFTGSPDDGLAPDGRPLAGPRQWAPPGIARPWPPNEYLGDGGDARNKAVVGEDWRIDGLEPEDTLAHFETLDGRTLITPSNHVKLYAPRFAAVRRVSVANSFDQEQNPVAARRRREASAQERLLPTNTVLQPRAPLGEVGRKNIIVQQQDLPPLLTGNEKFVAEAINRFKPYEDLSIIRIGQLVDAEKAMLARRVDAAIAWTRDQGAQVTINGKKAIAAISDKAPQITYTVDSDKAPRLRLIKVASTDVARPGDIVEFTLRFDNTGDELIGNVTIVDSLTTRLEYVPDSASSSAKAKAKFSFEENDAQSLVLRWEVIDPLAPGHGGILRFKCRVR